MTPAQTNTFQFDELNFNAFSESKNWVGFFERRGRFSDHVMEEAIGLFESFFGREISNFRVITALAFENEKIFDKKFKYHNECRSLADKRILRPLTGPLLEYFCADGDPDLPYKALVLSGPEEMNPLSKIMMGGEHIRGEVCFFINTQINVAVYPHADTGYGCIGLNGDVAGAIDFLKYCRDREEFSVVFKHDFPERYMRSAKQLKLR